MAKLAVDKERKKKPLELYESAISDIFGQCAVKQGPKSVNLIYYSADKPFVTNKAHLVETLMKADPNSVNARALDALGSHLLPFIGASQEFVTNESGSVRIVSKIGMSPRAYAYAILNNIFWSEREEGKPPAYPLELKQTAREMLREVCGGKYPSIIDTTEAKSAFANFAEVMRPGHTVFRSGSGNIPAAMTDDKSFRLSGPDECGGDDELKWYDRLFDHSSTDACTIMYTTPMAACVTGSSVIQTVRNLADAAEVAYVVLRMAIFNERHDAYQHLLTVYINTVKTILKNEVGVRTDVAQTLSSLSMYPDSADVPSAVWKKYMDAAGDAREREKVKMPPPSMAPGLDLIYYASRRLEEALIKYRDVTNHCSVYTLRHAYGSASGKFAFFSAESKIDYEKAFEYFGIERGDYATIASLVCVLEDLPVCLPSTGMLVLPRSAISRHKTTCAVTFVGPLHSRNITTLSTGPVHTDAIFTLDLDGRPPTSLAVEENTTWYKNVFGQIFTLPVNVVDITEIKGETETIPLSLQSKEKVVPPSHPPPPIPAPPLLPPRLPSPKIVLQPPTTSVPSPPAHHPPQPQSTATPSITPETQVVKEKAVGYLNQINQGGFRLSPTAVKPSINKPEGGIQSALQKAMIGRRGVIADSDSSDEEGKDEWTDPPPSGDRDQKKDTKIAVAEWWYWYLMDGKYLVAPCNNVRMHLRSHLVVPLTQI
jgi:hypothetical protein